MITSPCEKCHARRFCTRRCYAYKDWQKRSGEKPQIQSTEVIRVSECKKCKAPIIWLKTPRGKWMCADEGLKRYKQNPEGKDLVVTDRGEMIRCDLEFEGLPTGMARTPHWATCPFADQFRKPRSEDA